MATAVTKFRCGTCGEVLGLPGETASKVVRCGKCHAVLEVPEQARVNQRRRKAQAAVGDADEVGFQLRNRRGDDEDMDLTPMVDVTFLLLIFFMITASFSLQKALEIPTPDPPNEGAAQTLTIDDLEDTSVIVRIEADGKIYVDDELLPNQDALIDRLNTIMRDDRKTDMVIEAANEVPLRTVVFVYDAGNEIDMQRIRLASPPEEG
ncbi:ExbD/TolR family protein [Calycomorphotria hydatis]|uniref:Biopolymer transport protein ExbD n=1 Tax=Calycomorphotria hydatis TaxID=2528027 RepID=A0A517T7V7_9PLAN|nr:biopolymer transporter ExbD [Calycomorphotria hydatis]QDT64459.1 biopolymer transport protein ExbD [Calycomorphotria hydatis]